MYTNFFQGEIDRGLFYSGKLGCPSKKPKNVRPRRSLVEGEEVASMCQYSRTS
jgi:hypothetical protein